MIELAILGLLADRDLHGYELKKRLGELPGARPSVSFGSLYPALGRLESADLVKAVDAPADSKAASTRPVPMTGSLGAEVAAFRAGRPDAGGATRQTRARHPRVATRGRRGKKVYGLTDTGRAELIARLTTPGRDGSLGDDRAFAQRVAFCRHLRPEQRLVLFERRRRELADHLDATGANVEAEARNGSDRRLDTYLRALRDRATESIHHDLAWLDWLIHTEQGAAERSPAGTAPNGGTNP